MRRSRYAQCRLSADPRCVPSVRALDLGRLFMAKILHPAEVFTVPCSLNYARGYCQHWTTLTLLDLMCMTVHVLTFQSLYDYVTYNICVTLYRQYSFYPSTTFLYTSCYHVCMIFFIFLPKLRVLS